MPWPCFFYYLSNILPPPKKSTITPEDKQEDQKNGNEEPGGDKINIAHDMDSSVIMEDESCGTSGGNKSGGWTNDGLQDLIINKLASNTKGTSRGNFVAIKKKT